MPQKYLKSFDLHGGTWLGLFTACMIPMCVASFLMGRDIPSGVVQVYAAVLTAFAVSKTVQKVKGND